MSLSRIAFGICAVVIALAGCGGSQPIAGAPAPGSAQELAKPRTGSTGDLVYVATGKGIKILSYPAWSIVDTIAGKSVWYAICSDPNTGNVFAVASNNNEIDEFAHGGTTPIATLVPPSGYSGIDGCAVDPTTGNLATTALVTPNNLNAILVFPGAQGTAIAYSDRKMPGLAAAQAYDDSGNLFVVASAREGGRRLAELQPGRNRLVEIKLDSSTFPRDIQWDGTHLVFQVPNGSGQTTVNQLQIVDKTSTIVNSFNLANCNTDYFYIYQGSLLSYFYPPKARKNYAIATWPYLGGGNPTSKLYGLTSGGQDFLHNLTVSVGQPHPQRHGAAPASDWSF